MRDSNSRHPRCKRGALPAELIAQCNDQQLDRHSLRKKKSKRKNKDSVLQFFKKMHKPA